MDPRLVAGLAERVGAMYAHAEAQLVALVARYARDGLDTPAWVARQQTQLLALRGAVAHTLAGVTPRSTAAVREAVSAAARIGDRAAQADLGRRLHDRSVSAASAIDPAAVHALAEEAVGLVVGTHPRILRATEDAYRRVVAQVAASTVTGVVSQRQAVQQAVNAFAREGVTAFVDSRGRRWHMDTYAEMAVRTATFRALNAGHSARLIAAGHDLVVISHHPRPAPVCRPFEGKLVSLTGRTPNGPVTAPAVFGGHPVTGHVVASMAEAEARGLHHPNCRHRHSLWRPGVDMPAPAPYDEQQYRDEQRLRGLERAARAARRQAAAAVTPAATRQAAARIAAVDDEIARHVAATGVPRRAYREQLREPEPVIPDEATTPDEPTPAGPDADDDAREELAELTAWRERALREADAATSDTERADALAAAERLGRLIDAHLAEHPQLSPVTAAPSRPPLTYPDLSDVPTLADLFDVDYEDANDADLRAALRGLEGQYGPFRVEIRDARYEFGSSTILTPSGLPRRGPMRVIEIMYEGSVLDGDRYVGYFQRYVHRDHDHALVVHHERLELHESARGQGFSTAFGTAMEGYYRRSGVDRIELFAALEDGGYAWARAGYDWDPEPSRLAEAIAHIRQRIHGVAEDASAADRQLLADILEQFDGPSNLYPSPREVVELAGEDPRLGEKIMRGSRWDAVKRLR